MPGTHNVDALFDEIAALADTFGFASTVEGKSLGRDLAGIAADSMLHRAIDEQRAADAAWDALDGRYKAWKIKKYGVGLIGMRTGQMLSLRSVLGGLRITDELVEMLYGKGEAPTGSHSGHFDPATDGAVTDIEKAFFFSERRPFFELSDEDADRIFARIEELLDAHLRAAAA